jgi:hypothetical protein
MVEAEIDRLHQEAQAAERTAAVMYLERETAIADREAAIAGREAAIAERDRMYETLTQKMGSSVVGVREVILAEGIGEGDVDTPGCDSDYFVEVIDGDDEEEGGVQGLDHEKKGKMEEEMGPRERMGRMEEEMEEERTKEHEREKWIEQQRLRKELRAEVVEEVRSEVQDSVREQVRAEVRKAVQAEVKDELRKEVHWSLPSYACPHALLADM